MVGKTKLATFDIHSTSTKGLNVNLSDLFGVRADSQQMQSVFAHFNTLRRPELAESDTYHDWVLVRRAGVELGFTEENYHKGESSTLWGNGELLFTQVYFYAGFDDVAQYSGELPFGVRWSDSREEVRARLSELAHTLHSSDVSDAWDVPGYRMTVHYSAGAQQQPDKLVCMQQPNRPGAPKDERVVPSVHWMTQQWGENVATTEWRSACNGYLTKNALSQGKEDGVIDFSLNLGLSLHVSADEGQLLLQAISLFGQAYDSATQWAGETPLGLDFEDSPHTLFRKITSKPAKRKDGELSGYAVWHTKEYTLHVLYSFVDNRILRIKLLAPGTWKSSQD
jgi:hypothetical protein